MLKAKAIICDIDGTLANDDHRKEAVKDIVGNVKWGKEDYDRYYELMCGDTPFDHIREILHRFENDHKIIFVTGRPYRYNNITLNWITAHTNLKNDVTLLMRREDDYRCDTIIKTETYENFIKPTYDVQFVLEDRKKVVAMWRNIGLFCLEVQESNF